MRIILFLSLCFTFFTSFSQTVTYDTIVEVTEVELGVFDTIYYVKKHVQFNEELVVVDTVRGNQWAVDIYGGMPISSGAVRYAEKDLRLNYSRASGHYFGASGYYNFPKNWSVRVGAKVDYQKMSSNYTRTTNYEVDVFEEVDDTLDTYFTIDELDTSYFHIIETKIVESTEQRTDYTDVDYDWELYFLKVPCQLSYKIELNRWSFSLLTGTSLNFQLQRYKGNSRDQEETIASFSVSGILSLQAGYYISNSTVIQVEPFFEKSFVNGPNNVTPSSQFSIGIGLKQFF